jgi:hypothetical protein
MRAQDHAAVARTLHEAFNRRDFDAALRLAHEDIEVVNVVYLGKRWTPTAASTWCPSGPARPA